MDCVSTWTVAKRKATEEQLTISRKMVTSLSDSPFVANMQKDMKHVNSDISTQNRYNVSCTYCVINELDLGPKTSQNDIPNANTATN